MKTYPLSLVGLETRKSVVIGGGKVAARKAEALLEAGANVTAISPAFCAEFDALCREYSAARRLERAYQTGDLEGAWIVITATDDAEVNHAVWDEACTRGCLVNVVDDPQHSNFILPAVVRRGEVTVAIGTGGGSPALARRLREKLEAEIGPEYGALAALLAELRPELIAIYPPGEARLQAALRLVDSELLEVVRNQGIDAARGKARVMLHANSEGDPEQL